LSPILKLKTDESKVDVGQRQDVPVLHTLTQTSLKLY
jgi:hypothetical protein